jgi:hypothetical protein
MKNLFSLFFKKANLTKHLLCLLFLIAHIAPIGSKAQSNFTCSFANPDGQEVVACGSVITATVNVPSSITTVELLFPNTFAVVSITNGSTSSSFEFVGATNFGGTAVPNGALIKQQFNITETAAPLIVNLAYRNCNQYSINDPTNTSNLFFDCIGNGTEQAIVSSPALETFADDYAEATNSGLPAISIATTQAQPSMGDNLGIYDRTFQVTLNSLSIESFDLNILNEMDINVLNLYLVKAGLPDSPLTSFNYSTSSSPNTFNLISTSEYYSIDPESHSKTINFKQTVTRSCNIISPNITTVSARVNCNCGNETSFFNTNPTVVFNSVVGTEITINETAIYGGLSPAPGVTNGCAGIYNYDVKFKVEGNAGLQSVSIPINSTNFTIANTGAVSYGLNAIGYPVSPAIPLTYDAFTNSSQNLTIVSVDFQNLSLSEVKFFTIRLQLNYSCSSAIDCQNTTFTLTPLIDNNITFNLRTNCDAEYSLERPLRNFTEPITPPMAIIGGATNFSYVIVENGLVPFNYQFTLPTTSPFSMIYSANNNTVFDCQNTSYRAVLSLVGATFDTQSISDLNISDIGGINTTIAVSDGNFIIDLPPNPVHPGVYDIDFNLSGVDCPATPPTTFGSYTFQLSIQAVCNSCTTATEPTCVRNVACASDLLFVHCPGDCDGLIGIDPGVTIKRSTFGWANEADYPNTPITNESFFDNLVSSEDITEEEKERQLHRLYPFDIFTVNAEGELKNYFTSEPAQFYTHNWVGFRMNFTNTNLGENFFNLIDYTLTFSQSGQTDIVINDLASVAIVPLGALGVAGLPTTMFQQELRWNLLALGLTNQTALNIGTWNITFTARFRVTATSQTVDIGFYPLDFQCQFISESYLDAANPSTFTSCDPYGASILVLIPEVQVAQQSVQYRDNFSDETPLINDNSVGATLPNNACGFHRIVGLRHRGGLGDAVDDFPHEFRPLSTWGDNATSTNLDVVIDLYNGSENYIETSSNPVNFSNANPNLPLLPAAEKGDITQDFQGLVLGINRNCPTYSQSESISLDLGLKHFAYLHTGFEIGPLDILQDINNDIIPNQIPILASDIISVNNLISLPGNSWTTISIPNDTSTFRFSLHSWGAAAGLPIAFSVRVVNSPNPPVVLNDFVRHNINPTIVGAPGFADGWFGFANGLGSYNGTDPFNSKILIDLNNLQDSLEGCYARTFELRFQFIVFCSVEALNNFFTSNSNNGCSASFFVDKSFKRAITSLAQANTSNNFEQDDCNLIWNLQVTNPSLIPIDVSTLNLNFATGLIYNSGEVSMNCGPNPPDNSNPPTILSLSNPSFQFITDNFNNSSIQTTLGIQGFGAGLPLLLLQPGCTLNYRLNFSTTNEICSLPSFDNTNIINANFTYSNICNDDTETPTNDGLMTMPIAVNNGGTNLSNIISQLSNGVNAIGSPCCVASSFVVQHACGTTVGSITYNNTDPVNSVVLTLYQPGTTSPDSDTILANSTHVINLPAGSYGITVFNNTTGAFFTADISIENHELNVVLSDVSICEGQDAILTPIIDPIIPSIGIEYSYLWNTAETSETIIVNTAGTYNVLVSNVSCSASASATVTVNPNPVITATASPEFIGIGEQTTLTATSDITPTNFTWGDGVNSYFGSSVIVSPEQTTTYYLSGEANACKGYADVTVTVYNMPNACWANPNSLIIPDGTTCDELYDLVELNFPDNAFIVSSGGQTFKYIFASNTLPLTLALEGNLISNNSQFQTVFWNVTFKNNSESKISNDGALLHFYGCNLSSCGQYLWKGIENNTSSGLFFDGNTISDAVHAIEFHKGSRNIVKNSFFEDNLISVYSDLTGYPNSAAFINDKNTIRNNGILLPLSATENYPKSIYGYYFNNFGLATINSSMINEGTRFEHINNGIIALSTNLIVRNAYFSEISPKPYLGFGIQDAFGSAIYHKSNGTNSLAVSPYRNIPSNVTFSKCRIGTKIINPSSVGIGRITFDRVTDGIVGSTFLNSTVSIAQNTINAYRFGISLSNIDDVNYLSINNNTINILATSSIYGPPVKYGISVSAFFESCENSDIRIKTNSIFVNKGTSGIQFKNIIGANVNENQITRNGILSGLGTGNWAAIRCEANTRAQITCNKVLPGSSSFAPLRGKDFLISNSKETFLSCNQANGKTINGIEFTGANCTDSRIEGNEIGNHKIGLYYSNTAVVGPQPPTGVANTSGNKWNGTYTNSFGSAAAVNANLGGDPNNPLLALIIANQFRANQTSGTTIYPLNYPDNTFSTSWFFSVEDPIIESCILNNCGNSGGGGGTGGGGSSSNPIEMTIQQAIAANIINTTAYTEESKWMLEKNLIQLLMKDSLLLIDNSFFDFYHNNNFISTKQLLALEDSLRAAATQASLGNSILDSIALNILYWQEQALDSALAEEATTQLILLQENYNQFYEVNNALTQQIKSERKEMFLRAIDRNESIQPANNNEVLEKTVNDIYFRTAAYGIDTLTASDLRVLQTIIHLCPQAGGNAVYRARAIYEMINDSVEYDDSTICRVAGYYRTAMQEITEQINYVPKVVAAEKFEFTVFPNPIKSELNLLFNKNTSGTIKINDALGKLVYSGTMNNEVSKYLIDLKHLSTGIYIITFSNNKEFINKKFIKQ